VGRWWAPVEAVRTAVRPRQLVWAQCHLVWAQCQLVWDRVAVRSQAALVARPAL